MTRLFQTKVRLTGLLHAAGALACLCTLTGFLSDVWWLLELTSHFRLQYAVGLFALGLGFALQRQLGVVSLYGVFALANLLAMFPYPFSTAPEVSPRDPILRVVALNVHTANTRHDLVEAFLRREAPAVIVLTEIDDRWLAQLASLTNTWPHRVLAPRDDNFGIALFSRWPIRSGQAIELGEAGVPSVEAEVLVESRPVYVLGTHPLPPSSGENAALRNEQLALIADHLAARRGARVLVGDLNATPWSPAFRGLVRRSGLTDTLRGRGWQPTWPTRFFPFWIPLDHCLVSPDLTVFSRRVGEDVGSDHRPVVVALGVPTPGSGDSR